MKRTAALKNGIGIVIWFDPKSGYGFVKPDNGGPDLFVRPAAIGAAFAAGERVEYTLVTSGKPAKTEVFINAHR